MNKKYLIGLLLLLVIVLFSTNMDAQCAMCKLNAENAASDNSGFAEGLNNGILYLMGFPYLILLVGIAVFSKVIFKKYKLNKSV